MIYWNFLYKIWQNWRITRKTAKSSSVKLCRSYDVFC